MSDFAAARIHQTGQNQYSVSYGDDKGNFAEFSLEPVLQSFESESAGRQIYKDEIFITIYTPADRSKKVFRKAKLQEDVSGPSDKQRFPQQWAAFENQREQVQDGMPIEQWPPLSKSQVLEFKSLKIHTVEALAGLSDQQLQMLGIGGLTYRNMAQEYLARDVGGASKLAHELENAKAQLAALQEQMAILRGKQPDLEAAARMAAHDDDEQPVKRRAGRPPKSVSTEQHAGA